MTDVMVAGGGRCGLHASRMLAERGLTVTLVERLPQAGGQEPERDAATLVKAAQAAGVKLVLGTLAVEYRNGSLFHTGYRRRHQHRYHSARSRDWNATPNPS